MIEIAIVEDEYDEAEQLENLLRAYGKNHSRDFSVSRFADPSKFLDAVDANIEKADGDETGEKREKFDLVFLDICMPGMTGMDVAKALRAHNSKVNIVFVTNMIQYAVEGYSVQASDFIVKPANAASVNRVMNRALAALDVAKEKPIVIKDSADGRTIVVDASDILYVEGSGHRITWHTAGGNYTEWGSMNAVANKLPQKTFARCHVSFLVNLKHVRETKKDQVTVGSDVLPVSRMQKNAFFAELAAYLGRGGA